MTNPRLTIAALDRDAVRNHPLPQRLGTDWQTVLLE
jgi:hypothetical protein